MAKEEPKLKLKDEAPADPVPRQIRNQSPTVIYAQETAEEFVAHARRLHARLRLMDDDSETDKALTDLMEAKRTGDNLIRALFAILHKNKKAIQGDEMVDAIARAGLSPYRVASMGLPVTRPPVEPFKHRKTYAEKLAERMKLKKEKNQ